MYICICNALNTQVIEETIQKLTVVNPTAEDVFDALQVDPGCGSCYLEIDQLIQNKS